jgi:hypothetical protein
MMKLPSSTVEISLYEQTRYYCGSSANVRGRFGVNLAHDMTPVGCYRTCLAGSGGPGSLFMRA